MASPQSSSEKMVSERDAKRTNSSSHDKPKEYEEKWAIIVGISEYQHAPWNLKYAHRDAQDLATFLESKAGGGFKPGNVVKLIDKEATKNNIEVALRSFLKKPDKNDLVLLYFACHGAPDRDRPNIMYLLTHDTNPDDISGTALPMREIDATMTYTLEAKDIVILADSCHSAAIANKGGRAVEYRAENVNRILGDLSHKESGIALFTSATANEVSREDKKWGDGHGVFTYYLLKGLKGDADGYPKGQRDKDGVVGAEELFEYVRDNVRKDSDQKQHPAIGTKPYDQNLPLAYTKEIQAKEHYDLGGALFDLGRRLDDRNRIRSAIKSFDTAIFFAPEPLP